MDSHGHGASELGSEAFSKGFAERGSTVSQRLTTFA